jgi:hypothetical protein
MLKIVFFEDSESTQIFSKASCLARNNSQKPSPNFGEGFWIYE